VIRRKPEMSQVVRFATALTVLSLGTVMSQTTRADSQVRQLLSPEWKVVHAENGQARLRVFTAGDGPIIVMLPARGVGPFELEPVSLRLVVAGFHVVLPEPRGYGESVGPLDGVTMRDLADDVARAIEAVGGAPVVVAGHAFGNRVGRMLAQERTDLVRGVVLIAAGGRFPPKPEIAGNLSTWLDQSLPVERRIAAAKAAFFGPQSNPTPEDAMLDGISAVTGKVQASAAGSKLFPVESWWPGGKAPMLVIQGLADVWAPVENGRSLKADYPDRVTLVELPDLGHFMVRERPDLVADAIIAFMHQLGH
jgi:pimeloyl-ACP methyl ester carboxylesterase